MPKAIERALKRKAKERFGTTTSPSARALIYGTMRKTGWVPSTQRKRKKRR